MKPEINKFVVENILDLPFSKVMLGIDAIVPGMNPNTIMQVVSDLVCEGELTPCYFNPITGTYVLLPIGYRKKLLDISQEDYRKVYRAYRKQMVQILLKEATPITQEEFEIVLNEPVVSAVQKRGPIAFIVRLVNLIRGAKASVQVIGA